MQFDRRGLERDGSSAQAPLKRKLSKSAKMRLKKRLRKSESGNRE
jgi:hypothetical protein